MAKYALGIDFGTLSVRALVADVSTGAEAGQAVADYPHGVMDRTLPTGEKLPPDWALMHPADYIECLRRVVPQALRSAGVSGRDIIGVGVDGTSCTLVAVDRDGMPLCLLPEWAHEKHAWPKMWKHHAAQGQADRMTQTAAARNEAFLSRYGGRISSEWLFPKALQILEEAPDVYGAAYQFLDLADWIVLLLTGRTARSGCLAGYKAFYDRNSGYPDEEYFASVNPAFRHVVRDKLPGDIVPVGGQAGVLSREGAGLTGLEIDTPVATAIPDAHVAMPAAGVTDEGRMLMIMGTSSVDLVQGKKELFIPGICGAVDGGVIPGLWCFEAGQCCVGDHFNWFVENLAPAAYAEEAGRLGVDLHTYLTEKAARLRPGESGLLALDWWNGNRSVLNDASLSGLMVGMTLTTAPEEIYRALIEATAFGTRVILESFEAGGLAIREIAACGGIAKKNAFLMQLYADVLGREIRVAESHQAPALGSAILGAAAAGTAGGGYDSIAAASERMGGPGSAVYRPDGDAHRVYDRLYGEYLRLHDLFGRGADRVMANLKALRREAST